MAERHGSAAKYVIVWVVLLGLTAPTVWMRHFEFGDFDLISAMAVATVKSALVLMFFMHLGQHGAVAKLTMSVSVVFVLLMIGLTVSDIGTRFLPARPPESLAPATAATGTPAHQP
jgi:cytochrome c oxidase subunit 4